MSENTSSELIVIENLTSIIFLGEGKQIVDEVVKDVEKRVKEFKADVTTAEGRDKIRSFAYKIATSKTAIDNLGKDAVEEENQKVKAVNAKRKKVKETLQALQDKARKPLTEWEDAEKERVESNVSEIDKIIRIRNLIFQDWQEIELNTMKARFAEIKGMKIKDWQEFSERANQVITEAIEVIESAIAKRETYDKEQAELEEFRKEKAEREKREYEEKLKAEAAEKSRLEDEQKAEREKLAAERKAKEETTRIEREKQAAIREKELAEIAAKRAEKAKVEAEKKAKADAEVAVLRERERVAAEQEAERQQELKREANKRHKSKIHKGIKDALIICGLDIGNAAAVLKALTHGTIPNVTIKY